MPPEESSQPQEAQRSQQDTAAQSRRTSATKQLQRQAKRRSTSWLNRALMLLNRGVDRWRRLLGWLRSQLPRPWQARLTDTVLTAIAAAVLVLGLVIANSGGAASPAAEAPPDTAAEAAPTAESPAVPPEQQKIAGLQEQVADITGPYGAGMVQSVQADFQQGTLLIFLGAQWYGLSVHQQDQLSQELYRRLNEPGFDSIYLLDPDDHPVARTPVVGDQMVILQRQSRQENPLGLNYSP